MSVTEFTVAGPNEGPYGVAVAKGEVWTTLVHAGVVAQLSGERFDLGAPDSRPSVIVPGPDDAVWFTRNGDDRIGRIATVGGVAVGGSEAAGPVGISAGADGAWFVEILAGQAGRITPDGKIEEFPLPAGSKPHAVVATDDGGCWITLWGAAALARLDAAGNLIEQFDLGADSEPHGLALDADGSVWVALEKGSVAHIQP